MGQDKHHNKGNDLALVNDLLQLWNARKGFVCSRAMVLPHQTMVVMLFHISQTSNIPWSLMVRRNEPPKMQSPKLAIHTMKFSQ